MIIVNFHFQNYKLISIMSLIHLFYAVVHNFLFELSSVADFKYYW